VISTCSFLQLYNTTLDQNFFYTNKKPVGQSAAAPGENVQGVWVLSRQDAMLGPTRQIQIIISVV
jgi:hypothetical protein